MILSSARLLTALIVAALQGRVERLRAVVTAVWGPSRAATCPVCGSCGRRIEAPAWLAKANIKGAVRVGCVCGAFNDPRTAPRLTSLSVRIASAFASRPLNVWKVCRRGAGVEHGWLRETARGVCATIEAWTRRRILAVALNVLIVAYVLWTAYHHQSDPHAPMMAAARFFVGAGNWSDTNRWSTTSGGAGGSAVPTNADDVTFDINSGAATLDDNGVDKVARGITVTNDYAQTLTFNRQVTISAGGMSLGTSMVFAGSARIVVGSNAATWTGNTIVCPQPMTITATAAPTWTGWIQSGLVTLPATGTNTWSGTLEVRGGIDMSPITSAAFSGATLLVTGDATFAMTNRTTGSFSNNITFNGSGKTFTFSGTTWWGGGTWTRTDGTVTFTGSTVNFIGTTHALASTFDFVNMTMPTSNSTHTISADQNVSGTLTLGAASNNLVTLNGLFNWNVAGSLTMLATGSGVNGTSTIVMTGTGTWSGPTNTAALQTHFTVNTAGTITVDPTAGVRLGGAKTFTFTAGTVNTANSTCTVNVSGATLNLNGITWNNLAFTHSTGTTTLNSNMACSGLLTLGHATTNNVTLNGNGITSSGGLRFNSTSGDVLGTTAITLSGAGTWDAPTWITAGLYQLTTTVTGTITVNGIVPFDNKTLTISGAGVLLTGNATAALLATANTTFDCGGAYVPAITCATTSVIITLNSDLGIRTALTLIGTLAAPVQIKSNSGGTLRKLTLAPGVAMDVIYCNPTDIDSRDGQAVRHVKGTRSNTFNWSELTPFTPPPVGAVVGARSIGTY